VADPSPREPSDGRRPPLDRGALAGALEGSTWRDLEVVDEVGSTNAVLLERAAADAPEGLVLVAEHQAAGRGRLERTWISPPRSGLTVSVLLRPDVPAARRGWLSLLVGVAVAEAVGEVAGVRAALKWPNDVLAADGRKLAGILAEAVSLPTQPSAVVVGVGLNVSTTDDELPDTGTSLAGAGATTLDRGALLLGYLRALEARYRGWVEVLGDPVQSGLARDYLAWSATVGTAVAVTMPDGSVLEGVAEAVDWDGRLVVATPSGRVELASGDVRHVRKA
jgi:BirA family transcriptional regulator, biotin operon repressor / biotin---[acetyl-CoA-carboxylase] ligase